MNRGKCIPPIYNGHYHPAEHVSDKSPVLLPFYPEIALHITRGLHRGMFPPDICSLQSAGCWTEIMVAREAAKALSFGEVWD